LRNIAYALKRSVSTISDEISKNSVKGKYDPQKANHKAYVRRHDASFRGKKIVSRKELREFVDGALSDGQSAEAIAGRLKHREKHLPYVSKDTIYRYLKSPYGKLIGIKWKKRIKPKKSRKVTKLKDRVFIDKRPKIIEKRKRIGDLEADFIVSGRSGKGILLTAVDRKLRVKFLELIKDVSIDEVHSAFERIRERFPEMKTITLDNDILFKMHKTLEKLLEVKIYFCHPYHSWEKGSVENANKEIRKFIPKGSDLSKYDQEFIQSLEEYLNQRFMRCLQYATPEEKLNEYRKNKKTALKAVVSKNI
jgi:transposase, IS30 family